jgi:class III poly(R)-hydroxyalkanoic acid synthase PhaE subunit
MSADPWSAWQAFGDAARSYLQNSARAASPQAAQRFSEFLREQFSTSAQPWQVPGAPSADRASANNMFDAPAFGATREHQQRAQRMADAVQRMDAAQRRLQRLWSDVLRDAATSFVAHLRPLDSAAPSAEQLRKLYDAWIDCAEDAYARVAHGEAFCQAQAELANASSRWRQEQQASLEHWSKWLDVPTRSEINSLTRRLRAVESQLRAERTAATQPSPRQFRTTGIARSKKKKSKKKS